MSEIKQKRRLIQRIEKMHELELVIDALTPEYNAEIIRSHELHKPNTSVMKLWIEIKDISEEKEIEKKGVELKLR